MSLGSTKVTDLKCPEFRRPSGPHSHGVAAGAASFLGLAPLYARALHLPQ